MIINYISHKRGVTMENKVALVYDGKEYQIILNEKMIHTTQTIEEAYQSFEKTIENNQSKTEMKWETIIEQIQVLNVEGVEIFEAHHAIQYKTLKYFQHTGMLFDMKGEEMLPLSGGIRLLLFLLERVGKKQLEESEDFISICALATKEGIVYHIKEDTYSLNSGVFNYGSVIYNFRTQEIHKGTHVEKARFAMFRDYIEDILIKK